MRLYFRAGILFCFFLSNVFGDDQISLASFNELESTVVRSTLSQQVKQDETWSHFHIQKVRQYVSCLTNRTLLGDNGFTFFEMVEVLKVQPSSLTGFLEHGYSFATVCDNLQYYFRWSQTLGGQAIPLSKFKQQLKWDKSEASIEPDQMDSLLKSVSGADAILLPRRVKLPGNIQKYVQYLVDASNEATVQQALSCLASTIQGAIKGCPEACESFYLAVRGYYYRRSDQLLLTRYVLNHKVAEEPGFWSSLFSCCFSLQGWGERYRSEEDLALLKNR